MDFSLSDEQRAFQEHLRQCPTCPARLREARQQQQLRDAAVARDAAIRELTRELENHLTRGHRGVVAAIANGDRLRKQAMQGPSRTRSLLLTGGVSLALNGRWETT